MERYNLPSRQVPRSSAYPVSSEPSHVWRTSSNAVNYKSPFDFLAALQLPSVSPSPARSVWAPQCFDSDIPTPRESPVLQICALPMQAATTVLAPVKHLQPAVDTRLSPPPPLPGQELAVLA